MTALGIVPVGQVGASGAILGAYCARCGEAYEPASDASDAGMCGPCRDVGPVIPRPDVACLVGPDDDPPDDDPPDDPYRALLERVGMSPARIDEPEGAEWVELGGKLDEILDDDTLDHAELALILREMLLQAWQAGSHDDTRRAEVDLAVVDSALRTVRTDVGQLREQVRGLKLCAEAGTSVLSVQRLPGELGAVEARLRDVEAVCVDALPEDD